MRRLARVGTTALMLVAFGCSPAVAQSAAGAAAFMLTTLAVTSTAGAFDALSAANQRIARALFAAQPPAGRAAHPTLTLDQIAARRQGGMGWGEIFNIMKSRGLVSEKSLGQLITKHDRAAAEADRAGQ